MDRALKERLIGAIVLVVVAVLVVPVFLDGPAAPDAVISEPVTLPGQNDQPRTQQTIVLQRDRNEPVPSATPAPDPVPDSPPESTPAAATPDPGETLVDEASDTPPASQGSQSQAIAREQAQSEPSPAEANTATTPSAGGSLWAVQLGSFSNRDNAEKLAADLRSQGYAAFLSRLDTSNGELHRVRVGPQKDRDAAERVAETLAKAGHKGQVVTHP